MSRRLPSNDGMKEKRNVRDSRDHSKAGALSENRRYPAMLSQDSSTPGRLLLQGIDPSEKAVPSGKVLNFYRERLAKFDSERREYEQELEKCRGEEEQLHTLRWENHTRAKEIQDLQRTLGHVQVQLLEEREAGLRMSRDNDNLKLELKDSQRKMKHLIAMTRPAMEEVTYFHGRSSSTSGNRTISGNLGSSRRSPSESRRAKSGSEEPRDTGKVVRVVYLPCDESESLFAKISTLEEQLAREQKAHQETLADFQRERIVREEEYQLALQAYEQRGEAQLRKLHETETQLRETVKRYLTMRYEYQNLEKRFVEETESLKIHADDMSKQMDSMVAQLRQEKEVTKSDEAAATKVEQQIEKRVFLYRSQERSARDSVQMLERRLAATEKKSSSHIETLQQRLDTLKKRKMNFPLVLADTGGGSSKCLISTALEDFCAKLSVVSQCPNSAFSKLSIAPEYTSFTEELTEFQERLDTLAILLDDHLLSPRHSSAAYIQPRSYEEEPPRPYSSLGSRTRGRRQLPPLPVTSRSDGYNAFEDHGRGGRRGGRRETNLVRSLSPSTRQRPRVFFSQSSGRNCRGRSCSTTPKRGCTQFRQFRKFRTNNIAERKFTANQRSAMKEPEIDESLNHSKGGASSGSAEEICGSSQRDVDVEEATAPLEISYTKAMEMAHQGMLQSEGEVECHHYDHRHHRICQHYPRALDYPSHHEQLTALSHSTSSKLLSTSQSDSFSPSPHYGNLPLQPTAAAPIVSETSPEAASSPPFSSVSKDFHSFSGWCSRGHVLESIASRPSSVALHGPTCTVSDRCVTETKGSQDHDALRISTTMTKSSSGFCSACHHTSSSFCSSSGTSDVSQQLQLPVYPTDENQFLQSQGYERIIASSEESAAPSFDDFTVVPSTTLPKVNQR